MISPQLAVWCGVHLWAPFPSLGKAFWTFLVGLSRAWLRALVNLGVPYKTQSLGFSWLLCCCGSLELGSGWWALEEPALLDGERVWATEQGASGNPALPVLSKRACSVLVFPVAWLHPNYYAKPQIQEYIQKKFTFKNIHMQRPCWIVWWHCYLYAGDRLLVRSQFMSKRVKSSDQS